MVFTYSSISVMSQLVKAAGEYTLIRPAINPGFWVYSRNIPSDSPDQTNRGKSGKSRGGNATPLSVLTT
jgi:hypothetical protein